MRISIAMATYNGAMYLQEQLDSFLNQTRLPDELIVCDDASTDDSVAMLEAFGRRAPFPVRLIRNDENLGFIRTFLTAISHCSGSVIFLSDQDDVWLPPKIQRLTDYLAENPVCLLVVHDAELTDSQLRTQGQTISNRLVRRRSPVESLSHGCCTAFRSTMAPLAAPVPPAARSHDIWLSMLADALSAKAFLPEVLIYHRRHGGNDTQTRLFQPKRLGDFDLLMMALTDTSLWTNPIGASKQRLCLLREQRDRIAARGVALFTDPDGQAKVRRAIDRLDTLIEANSQRESLLALPLMKRLYKALALYREGFYGNFSGAKSFLKDVLWRRA